MKSGYPKIGGRLRLAHEQNQQISITTEVIRYDDSVAVVRAVTTTTKGSFPGVEMASVEKDHTVVGNRDRVFTWDHCRVTHSLQTPHSTPAWLSVAPETSTTDDPPSIRRTDPVMKVESSLAR